MGTHEKHFELGERLFVANFFTALAGTSILTIIGAGMYFDWRIVGLGVFASLFTVYLSQGLYGGSARARSLVGPWVGVQLLLVVFLIAFLLTSAPAGHALAATWAVLLIGVLQVLCGSVLLGAREVRGFLAHQRGEKVAEQPAAVAVVEEEGPAWTTAGTAVVFADKMKSAVATLSYLAEVSGWVLIGLALLDIVGGGYLLATQGAGWGLIPLGIFTVLLALTLLTTADDMNYLTSTKGREVPHLTNAVLDVKVLLTLLLIGTVVTVIAVAVGATVA